MKVTKVRTAKPGMGPAAEPCNDLLLTAQAMRALATLMTTFDDEREIGSLFWLVVDDFERNLAKLEAAIWGETTDATNA